MRDANRKAHNVGCSMLVVVAVALLAGCVTPFRPSLPAPSAGMARVTVYRNSWVAGAYKMYIVRFDESAERNAWFYPPLESADAQLERGKLFEASVCMPANERDWMLLSGTGNQGKMSCSRRSCPVSVDCMPELKRMAALPLNTSGVARAQRIAFEWDMARAPEVWVYGLALVPLVPSDQGSAPPEDVPSPNCRVEGRLCFKDKLAWEMSLGRLKLFAVTGNRGFDAGEFEVKTGHAYCIRIGAASGTWKLVKVRPKL